MNVGILTQPIGHNFGCILQNWAVQQLLREMGHHPITIRWQPRHTENHLKHALGDLMRRTKLMKFFRPLNYADGNGMENFIRREIKASNILYIDQIPKFIKRRKIECIVVGSDQVWRPSMIETNHMFLPYENIRKIALSASFGTSNWEFSQTQTEKYGKLLKTFQGISVREKESIGVCQKKFNINGVIDIIDPTMLITSTCYEKLIKHQSTVSCSKVDSLKRPSLFAYFLDSDNTKERVVEQLAQEYSCNVYFHHKEFSVRDLNCVYNWVKNFQQADYIVTDSFHGTVFSIINRKPFITFRNSERGNLRFENLEEIFNISDHFYFEGTTPTFVNTDWDLINSIIEGYKKKAFDFLKMTLD